MGLKFTEELCIMTMKNDAKLAEELTCHFRIGMKNLRNFDPSIRKSKKFALYCIAQLTKLFTYVLQIVFLKV